MSQENNEGPEIFGVLGVINRSQGINLEALIVICVLLMSVWVYEKCAYGDYEDNENTYMTTETEMVTPQETVEETEESLDEVEVNSEESHSGSQETNETESNERKEK